MSDISLVLSIVSIILSIIGIILYIIRERRYRIHNEKIRAKKRIFKDWYQNMKSFVGTMEFTGKREKDHYTMYNYSLRKKDGKGFEEFTKARIFLDRIRILGSDAHKLCGYDVKETDITNPLKMKLVGNFMDEHCITYPNDKLPENTEQIKKDLLNNISNFAKENGLKKRNIK